MGVNIKVHWGGYVRNWNGFRYLGAWAKRNWRLGVLVLMLITHYGGRGGSQGVKK